MHESLAPQHSPAVSPGKLAEDIHTLIGMIRRGWRFVAISAAVCLTLALFYAARGKTSYLASARLLVLQQGGRPLPGAGGDPLESMRGGADSLSTHVMIIRSPIIVERALAAAGLKGLPADSVADRLTVTVPDETAKVLQIGYAAGSRDETKRVIEAVIKGYEDFLKNNYQKNTGDTIKLFMKARDELSGDLARMEREYLEYRQKNPSYVVDDSGRSFVSRRLDQWDQASNQAMVRALNLQSQLELGRKLIGEGADTATVAAALNRLGSLGGEPGAARPQAEGGVGLGHSFEQLELQLEEVGFQRLTAARLLDYLRSEQASSAPSTADPAAIAEIFEAEPETRGLRSDLARARSKYDNCMRLSRSQDDPAVAAALGRLRELEGELAARWQKQRPKILAGLAQRADDEAVRSAEAELRTLTARESALRDSLAQVKADRVRRGRQEREQLAGLHGPRDPRVEQLDRQIAALEGGAAGSRDAGAGVRTGASSLLGSLQQSLEAVEVMRARIQQQFRDDVVESKKAEIGQLAETNLRNNLERQRALFNSVVDQLKQAQLVSDFGSITAQTINPPTVREIRPRTASIVLAGLVAGVCLGAGMAYVADQLDSRIRSLPEMRRALELGVLGIIPELTSEQREVSSAMGMICHTMPRSLVSESYKTIRTNFEFLRRSRDAQVILVTSPQSGDGKSTTASNLAISLAHAGRAVLLVDGDMRRPTQHQIHGMGKERGLPHVLKDILPLRRVAAPTQVENLDILPAGPEVSNPAELLASHHLARSVEEMRREYDVVIIDSPPLLAVADPSIIAAVVDGIILVVRATTTRRPDVERTVEVLQSLGTPVLGAVINGVTPELMGSRYGYGHGYGYGYGSHGDSSPTALDAGVEPFARPEITDGVASH